MKRLLCTALMLIFCCLAKNNLLAQTTQASISGIISDEQNKPVPGVSVTVKNESTGFTTRTNTNSQGEYTFKELPLGGPYTKGNLYRFRRTDFIGLYVEPG